MPEDVTRRIGAFCTSVRLEDIPEEIRSHVKLCILDTIGCGLFGSGLSWGNIIADWAFQWGGSETSSVFRCSRKLPPPLAALVNGTMIHGFEMDDLHKESVVHLGSVAFPPALALGEYLGTCSGADLLCAVAVGYEVGARVGSSIGSRHLLRGFHPTGTSGTFAAAAASAKILGLDTDLTLQALGIAGTQGAGLMAAQYSSMVKRMHAGRAAQSGVYAATLAQKGFTGIMNIIEADYGGFCQTMSDSYDLERITRGLGQDWEAGKVTFKPYPCCGSIHTALDGLTEIADEYGIELRDIKKVRVRVTTATKKHVGWPYRPESVTAAQMNMYYCLAAFLVNGHLTTEEFKPYRISDPGILRRISDISVEVDTALDSLGPHYRHSVTVEVDCDDGRSFGKRVDHSKGSPQKPMSTAEMLKKFRTTAESIGYARASEIEELVLRLETVGDLSEFAALLRE